MGSPGTHFATYNDCIVGCDDRSCVGRVPPLFPLIWPLYGSSAIPVLRSHIVVWLTCGRAVPVRRVRSRRAGVKSTWKLGMRDAGCWVDARCFMLDPGSWILDRCGMLDTGYWMLDAGCWTQDHRFWIIKGLIYHCSCRREARCEHGVDLE